MFVYVFKDTHITWLVLESSQTDAEFKSKMYISELIRKSLPCSVTQAFLDNRHLREHAALNPLNDLSVAVNMCSPLWFLYCKRKSHPQDKRRYFLHTALPDGKSRDI